MIRRLHVSKKLRKSSFAGHVHDVLALQVAKLIAVDLEASHADDRECRRSKLHLWSGWVRCQ